MVLLREASVRRKGLPSTNGFMLQLFVLSIVFLTGFYFGVNFAIHTSCISQSHEVIFSEKVSEAGQEKFEFEPPIHKSQYQLKDGKQEVNERREATKFFSNQMKDIAIGAVRVEKSKLLELYDYGIPVGGGQGDAAFDHRGESESIILYSRQSALPNNTDTRIAAMELHNNLPLIRADIATENCEELQIVMTQNRNARCLAIVGNQNSMHNGHIQRFFRKGHKSLLPLSDYPLVPIGRGVDTGSSQQDNYRPPDEEKIREHWNRLSVYFNAIDDLTEKLEKLLLNIHKNKTVIVMVVNSGHVSLLTNFVCSCRSRSFDITNLIVFATDEEAVKVASDLNLTSFYDERLFGHIPTTASKQYGDSDFKTIVYAKIVAAQLVNMLGYHMLFQDVDIIWNKDPVSLFLDKSESYSKYDMLFMDDGIRHIIYAPYHANSGFYFAKSNDKTKFFFRNLLFYADNTFKWTSDQGVFGAILAEYASFLGLKIKTLPDIDFPGGFHYHRSKGFIKDIVEDKAHPVIFHMHWTKSAEDKISFMKQMGMWYVENKCISGQENDKAISPEGCCSANPLIECFYLDKGSVPECKNDKSMQKFDTSVQFWI